MRTLIYVLLRIGFTIIPFISGLILGITKWRQETYSSQMIAKVGIIIILYIFSGIFERLFEIYFKIYREGGITNVSTLSFFIGWSIFLWWPNAKRFMGKSGTRLTKIFILILLAVWITGKLELDIKVISPIIFFSFLVWAIWELKIKIFPPTKGLLNDEI